jgi:hypothetical protein
MAILKIYADSKGPGKCRSCGASITWAEMVSSGKRMPFDGEIVAVKTEQPGIGERQIEHVDTTVNLSHFATCPDSEKWRRR